ncbi:MAG: hypothetical protein EOP81_04000 [Variovorax sp.]|nr:MAG: hypothetical protein EOP81_04000 [Variovorax sp.]
MTNRHKLPFFKQLALTVGLLYLGEETASRKFWSNALDRHSFSSGKNLGESWNMAVAARRRALRTYGLKPSERATRVALQNGGCAICDVPLWQTVAVVDHDHTKAPADEGYVRGILCSACNVGLGMFGDDPERLSAAISYLRNERPDLS